MVLYKKLNLCSTPLNGDCIADLMEQKENFNQEYGQKYNLYNHLYASGEIEKYISPVLLQQLSHINVKPAIFVNFSEYGPTHETWLHSDLTYHNDDWKPLGFGINWELAPGETTFNWYKENNVATHKSGWPTKNEMSMMWPRRMINGIHYFKEEELTNIGSVTFDVNTAYLVRTDIPHKIISHSPGNIRKCISVRFFYEDIPTFENALEVFKPYYA